MRILFTKQVLTFPIMTQGIDYAIVPLIPKSVYLCFCFWMVVFVFFTLTQDNEPSEYRSFSSFWVCIFKERKRTCYLVYLQVKLLGILIWKFILALDYLAINFQRTVKALGSNRQNWIFTPFWCHFCK